MLARQPLLPSSTTRECSHLLHSPSPMRLRATELHGPPKSHGSLDDFSSGRLSSKNLQRKPRQRCNQVKIRGKSAQYLTVGRRPLHHSQATSTRRWNLH